MYLMYLIDLIDLIDLVGLGGIVEIVEIERSTQRLSLLPLDLGREQEEQEETVHLLTTAPLQDWRWEKHWSNESMILPDLFYSVMCFVGA